MKKIKILLNSLISIFITIFSLYLFFNNDNNEITFLDLFNLIKEGWFYLSLASILLIFSVYLRTHRWQYLFDLDSKIDFALLFKSQLIGYFANNILPIRLGDVVRSYVVSKHTKKKISYLIGTIAMERVVDTLTILFFSIITLLYYGPDYLEIQFIFLNIPFIVIISIIVIMGYLLYHYLIKFSISEKIHEILKNIWSGFSDIQLNQKQYIVFLSIVLWSIFVVNVYLIQLIFPHLKLSIFDCLLILVASSLIQMIPVGFGAIGVFHLGVQGVLNKLGINDFNNFIIILHLYSLFIYTLTGGYYFITDKILVTKNFFNHINKN